MILAQLVYYLLSTKIDPPNMFAFIGFVLLLASVYIIWLLPDVLVRFVLWVATHSLYRIRVSGRFHIPQNGAALIVSNHVSWVDGILIQAAVDRPIRFLIESGYAHLPVLRQMAKLMKIIPISSRSGPKEMLKAVRTARGALAAGEVVCVFAEGQITRTGGLMPFRRGFQRMTKGLDSVPLVPAYLDHVWGSIFSFQGGRFLSKWPRQVPYPSIGSFWLVNAVGYGSMESSAGGPGGWVEVCGVAQNTTDSTSPSVCPNGEGTSISSLHRRQLE